MMIRVLIADDQTIVRQGLRMMLEQFDIIQVVGEATNGEEALKYCELWQPHLILMDIRMPGMDGVEATKRIKQVYPQTNILILTTFTDDQYIFEALQHGASGYLLKDVTPDKLVEAIQIAQEGGAIIHPQVASKMIHQMKDWQSPIQQEKDERVAMLTERELEILQYLGQGLSNQEIAEKVYITQGTVKNHISSLLQKLECRDRTQLALFAVKNHLL